METQQQKTPAYGKPQADVRSPRYGFQSPNVRTRVQEKEELSELNNRLCVYIDRMRYLESQNTKLHAEITTSKESKSKEFEDVKHMYEAELSSARKLIDDTSKERASIQIENNKLKLAVDDLNNRLEKEVAARSRAEDELKRVERRLHEKESLNAVLSKERKDLERQVKDLESQLKETQDALQELRAEHERESIRRTDAENRLLTLQEEMDFKEDVHNKEVTALQNHAESMNLNLKITGEADDNYDNILRDKLQEIREEFEEEGETLKEELEQAYRSKYDAMCADNEKGRSQVSDLQESNSALKTELNCIKSDYGVLESKVTQLQRRISELSNLRKIDGEEYARKLEAKDFKISELQTKIEELENEYENLLSIKVALDVEIAAYRKLLEGEEERLNMTPSPHRSASSSRRGTKRSRVEEATVENESVGSIEVVECEPTGKFISIQNKSDKDEPLGGWYLQQIMNGQEENAVEFKFTPKYVLKANAKVTIWSESSGMKQKPPSDLVLKKMDWSYGAQVVTQVINPDAEIVAKQTLIPTPPSTETRRARKRRSGNQNRESCLMM